MPVLYKIIEEKFDIFATDLILIYKIAEDFNSVTKGNCGFEVVHFINKFLDGIDLDKVNISK